MGHYRPTIKEICQTYGVTPKHALVLGARRAEECDEYIEAGFSKVIWVEADPEKAAVARNNVPENHIVYPCAVTKRNGFVKLKRCNDDAASSLLPLGEGTREYYPGHCITEEILVPGYTLDTLLACESLADINYVLADVQGSELDVFFGAQGFFKNAGVEIIDIELDTHSVGMYEGGALAAEVTKFLNGLGFNKLAGYHHFPSSPQIDSIFVKRKLK